MIKKNNKFANIAQGSQYTVKDPEPEANDKKQIKKKKTTDGKKSNLDSIPEIEP